MDSFAHIRKQVKKDFQKIGKIKCPAFPNEEITFNAKGFGHLFYKGSNTARSRNIKEIIARTRLIPLAVKLLKIMPIWQEEDSNIFNGKTCYYWSFEGVIDNYRIKVIVRQLGNGGKHFWSIIPNWRKLNNIRLNNKGKLSKK